MIKVANHKVINRLAFKSFKANKTRNWIAVIAIALTTILFTTLFTISFGVVNTFQEETMRQSGGSAQGSLKYLTEEQYQNIKDHPLIRDIGRTVLVNMAENKEFLKRHTEIAYADDVAMKLGFTTPTTGEQPIKVNEMIADTVTLDLLGIPHEIGQKVTLEYSIKGEKRSYDFVLSGFYEGDPAFSVGLIFVSRSFIDAELSNIEPNYNKDFDSTGTIRADIMFSNSLNIEQNIQKVITDSGYSLNEADSNYVAYGINWAYMSTSFGWDLSTVIGVLIGASLIILTGYLIIYNIFQISVIKDIRFYGLLKTIGTTPKQIKRIIHRQALILSVIGIPMGVIFGYVLGNTLLPLVVNVSSYSGKTSTSANPMIFIGSVIFSLITVYISCRKPGKIAGKVSPVEAVRFSGISQKSQRATKKSTDGGKLYKMALSNLGRNRKRTIIVVISMSLSLILLNSVFTISKGFDMDKFISKFVKTDFLIGHANYFNTLNGFRSEDDALSDSFIKEVSKKEGFEDGGRLYYNLHEGTIVDNNKEQFLQLFGLEDFPLHQLEIVEGELDDNKLQSGKYIIEGLSDDDHGNIYWDRSHYAIGDKVKITTESGTHEYEVLAKTRMGYNNHVRFWGGYGFYLPAKEFAAIVPNPTVMSYQFNVDDAHVSEMNEFVKGYTEHVEPAMDYESKGAYEGEFIKMQTMLLTVGGVLSVIIGLIGILNFINSMLTSIIARRQEFAMLQSIGMTDKQLNKLLIFEGLFYALATILISLLLGVLFSYFIINGIASHLWFFSYTFVIAPLLLSYPILLILSVMIPFVVYRGVNKRTIVERLRETE
ncbi:putative ABC transport system permease protein [Paenibacillus sp. DS2015]|uniref:ABC transporter permease n=1 Tax=Paenibacillus sp. DS2015 TaxID=3373917 RepID=UPI003D224409